VAAVDVVRTSHEQELNRIFAYDPPTSQVNAARNAVRGLVSNLLFAVAEVLDGDGDPADVGMVAGMLARQVARLDPKVAV
jgi:hypothetical protein